jgi:cell division protein FtsA
MARNERYVVGLDIGTTRISCVVAEMKEQGAVELVGLGEASSRGLRKGVVVHLDTTVEAIKIAVEQAEVMAGVNVESATVGIAGPHIRSFNSRGVVAVSGKDRTVSKDDMRRVLDAARAVSIPQDREILHVLPQEFVLDNQGGIASPVGLTGHIIRTKEPVLLQGSLEEVNRQTSALGGIYTDDAWAGQVNAISSAAGGTIVITEFRLGSPDWNQASDWGIS